MRKQDYCLCENKGAYQLCSKCTADLCLCFRFTDNTIPSVLLKSENFKFLTCCCSCVGPGRKPRRLVFSGHGSIKFMLKKLKWSLQLDLFLKMFKGKSVISRFAHSMAQINLVTVYQQFDTIYPFMGDFVQFIEVTPMIIGSETCK